MHWWAAAFMLFGLACAVLGVGYMLYAFYDLWKAKNGL